ncbi:MAG: diguanylate cyclase [Candidatus Omnitrophica bacterium]|nr:diguanylate cyclase [Candidatus Omnitrophota bacterium]
MKFRFRYTLRLKIVTLLILFSIIFIGAFCVIQIRNQLSALTTFNSYRAKLSAFIIKDNLEKIITDNPLKSVVEISSLLQGALLYLKESEIVENALIFNTKGDIIFTSGVSPEDRKLKPTDYRIAAECVAISEKGKWFIPHIDPIKRIMNLYIPLLTEYRDIEYIVKATFSLGNIEEALKQVYVPIIITIITVIFANILLGSILTTTIVKPINALNKATREIADGNLALKVNIKTKDEIEDLGDTFNYMTEALQRMKETAENANPLTKLPGNNVIHEEITKRIYANRKFVVVYSDLDNFKAFNDKYGIGAGDKVIKLTADIMRESLKLGSSDDFLGHEGGDDFVLITTPANVEKVTNYITEQFDSRVRNLYKKEDIEQGFIIAHARDGTLQQFPIMTISLAGVSNEKRPLSSYGEITNICAEVKKKVKTLPKMKSVFLLDKRIE